MRTHRCAQPQAKNVPVLGTLGLLAAMLACAALPARGMAECIINGPTSVADGARFMLCAPSGYTYRWAGPGLPDGATSRCITVPGRSSGLYEYTLTLYSRGVYQDQCRQVVTVGDSPNPDGDRPEDQCTITGPDVIEPGETAQLCGPTSTMEVHQYVWTGPGGYRSTARCAPVTRPGTYTLTTRNQITGHERRCTHRIELRGGGGGGGSADDCAITGPDTFEAGTRVRLCGPSGASSYRWTGPDGFVSTSSCISVNREGSYSLSVRDRFGDTRQCSHFLDAGDGTDDADEPFAENCPRNYVFWSGICRNAGTDVSAAELRSIARCVDDRAQAFNWTDDAAGLCQSLRPAAPLTQRKQAARQLATLFANICAAERGITARNGQSIGLDADTPLSFRGARTIGELAALVDRMLARGRGSFAKVNAMMHSVNSGRGIGPVCNE